MRSLLDHWPRNADAIATATLDAHLSAPLNSFRVHAPLEPRQVYCTIGNYRSQLLEASLDADSNASPDDVKAAIERRAAGEPYICMKPGTSIAGAFDTLSLPDDVSTLDWEVELGVVIGRAAHHVHVEDAIAHVAGYCTVNDITWRSRVFRADPKAMGTDFLQAKGSPGWLPLGPWIVPAHGVPDPSSLRLTLSVNGQVMQDGSTSDMLFDVAEQIAYLSRHVRLQPGDLVCTGSPAGFGAHHGRFLQAGDVMETEVVGLGRQRTHITRQGT